MALIEKLKSKILPKAVADGAFGADKVQFIDYKKDDQFIAEDQCGSSIHFGDVIFETDKGVLFTQSVVVKTQHEHLCKAKTPLTLGINFELYNEVLFYAELLPLLRECDTSGQISKIVPHCYYASAVRDGDHSDDILILENVQKLGFKHAESRAFVDFDHVKLALSWIGRFHALSLVCKRKFPKRFEKLVSKIVETHWMEERVIQNCDTFYVKNCKRGILPLQKDPAYKNKLEYLLALAEEADLSMAKTVAPVEPLAMICHGDFCRNNIFYKYNSDGLPYKVIFFDFAITRYSSPIIDLSFFLFTSCSPEVRSSHWAEILRTYHSALVCNLDHELRDVPSLQDVMTDFQCRGFYGYVRASYDLPTMLQTEGLPEERWKLTIDDYTNLKLSTGGKESTFYVMQIVKHMLDKNFDFQYIKNFKLKSLRKLGD